MWYFSGKVQTTGWPTQAWLNTSSSVSQTRSPWHLGSVPPAQGRALARGPPTLLLNTSNPRVYCLSPHWWLSFVRKHNWSGQSLPAACAPSQRHTVYNPLYSLARSHSQVAGFHELAVSGKEHGSPRECRHSGGKTIALILSLPVAHSDNSQTREATKTNLCCWVIFTEDSNESREAVEKDAGVGSIDVKRGSFVVKMTFQKLTGHYIISLNCAGQTSVKLLSMCYFIM